MAVPLKWKIRRTMHRWGVWSCFEKIRTRLARDLHDGDFEYFRTRLDLEGLVLDVGANAGQSARALAQANDKLEILSVEPNPTHVSDLESLITEIGPRFRFLNCGLGAHEGQLEFHVPVVDGIALTQEGTFDPAVLTSDPITRQRIFAATGAQDFSIQKTKVPVMTVDQLQLANVVAIKIDVQGFELEVLQGALGTLRSLRPVLMIERNPKMDEIRDLLEPLGYQGFSWKEGRLWPEDLSSPSGDNLFFTTGR